MTVVDGFFLLSGKDPDARKGNKRSKDGYNSLAECEMHCPKLTYVALFPFAFKNTSNAKGVITARKTDLKSIASIRINMAMIEMTPSGIPIKILENTYITQLLDYQF